MSDPEVQSDERRASESAASAGPSSLTQASAPVGSAEKPTVVLVIGVVHLDIGYHTFSHLSKITITEHHEDRPSCNATFCTAYGTKLTQGISTQCSAAFWYPVANSCRGRLFQVIPAKLVFAGMAGSGKTTLLQRISAHLSSGGKPGYILNLDPAVSEVPYGANIDIRDTVHHFFGPALQTVAVECRGFR